MEKECKYSFAFLVLGLPLILSGPLVSGTKGFTSSEGLWPQPLIHFTNFLVTMSDDEALHHILTGSSFWFLEHTPA